MDSKQTFDAPADTNRTVSGQLFKQLTGAGLVWLEHNHEHVNQLNVFPVPDGDTGTNMLLTMRQAYGQVAASDETHIGRVALDIADGALNGSRGNSGTILSQLFAGFGQALADSEAFDAERFAAACERAVEMAYSAVANPTEGTILTVAREAKDAVVARVAAGERDLVALLKLLVFAARSSLRRTPELLPVLAHVGVVDSGGQGLVYVLEGMLQHVTGKSLPEPKPITVDISDQAAAPEAEDEEDYGYDVQFRMYGDNLDVNAIRSAIDEIGWSTVVVGNDQLVKVHVHVHDPGRAISYAINQGVELDDVVVENMWIQVTDRANRSAPKIDADKVAVVVVAPGIGLRRLFANDLQAARVITGGQTMNPSTGDILGALRDLPNERIVILPNNKNIYLTAQQAARMLPEKDVRVVPSRSVPQGISAMVAYSTLRDTDDLDELVEAMTGALDDVISAEITTATRDYEMGPVTVHEGQLIGLINGDLVVAGTDDRAVMHDVLVSAGAADAELITVYYGLDCRKKVVQAVVDSLTDEFSTQEFEIVYGGQALYPYIISIE